jgi:hypothetical protein
MKAAAEKAAKTNAHAAEIRRTSSSKETPRQTWYKPNAGKIDTTRSAARTTA